MWCGGGYLSVVAVVAPGGVASGEATNARIVAMASGESIRVRNADHHCDWWFSEKRVVAFRETRSIGAGFLLPSLYPYAPAGKCSSFGAVLVVLRAVRIAEHCGESLGSCFRHQSIASGSVDARIEERVLLPPVAAFRSRSANPSACAFSLVRILRAAISPVDAFLTRIAVKPSRVIDGVVMVCGP